MFAKRGKTRSGGRAGYFPQCKNFYQEGCRRREDSRFPCSECPLHQYRPLEDMFLVRHLMGASPDFTDVIGIYPMLPDSTCRFLVFDFDNHEAASGQEAKARKLPAAIRSRKAAKDASPPAAAQSVPDAKPQLRSQSRTPPDADQLLRQEVSAFLAICDGAGIPVLVERSRSGRGYHVWMFFTEPVPAKLARQLGQSLLSRAAAEISLSGFAYYDRMIPEQDSLPARARKESIGNLVALPLQGAKIPEGNSVFIDRTWHPYPDQWQALASTAKLTPGQLSAFVGLFGQAPELGCDFLAQEGEPAAGQSALRFSHETGTTAENGGAGSSLTPGSDRTGSSEVPSPHAGTRCAQGSRQEAGQSAMGLKPWQKSLKIEASDLLAPKLEITLADGIYLPLDAMKPRLQNRLRRLAAYQNPQFYQKYNAGFSTKGIPRIVYLGYDQDGYLCLPRGLLEPLIRILQDAGIPFAAEDCRDGGNPLEVSFSGQLRPRQQEAADALLRHDCGILEAATAFGKTAVGAWLIARLKTSALIITHTRAIQDQWMESLRRFLSFGGAQASQPETAPAESPGVAPPANLATPEADAACDTEKKPGRKAATVAKGRRDEDPNKSMIGSLSGAGRRLTGMVDVVMAQSLNSALEEILSNGYGLVIVDECHHATAGAIDGFLDVSSALHIYGLSATARRRDRQEMRFFMSIGPVLHRFGALEQIRGQNIPHYVVPRFCAASAPADFNPQNMYQSLAAIEARNAMIIADVEECLKRQRTPLVLTRRREHAKCLAKSLEGDDRKVLLILGGATEKQRRETREILESVANTESDGGKLALVAVDSCIGEGFNFPRLDTLFLTMPVSWSGAIIQYAGRLHREYEGKRNVIIYDYVDIQIPHLERSYHRRIKTYRQMGYRVGAGPETAPTDIRNIFDIGSCRRALVQDLEEAKETVLVFAPTLEDSARTPHADPPPASHPNEKTPEAPGIRESECADGDSAPDMGRNLLARAAKEPAADASLPGKERPVSRDDESGNIPPDLLATLEAIQSRGVKVTFITSEAQKRLPERLLKSQAAHKRIRGMHENLVIIDRRILWYAGAGFLSDGPRDETAIRLPDPKSAREMEQLLMTRAYRLPAVPATGSDMRNFELF
ncbi:MAG: DEAD/DEAH box helicase family protein [Succinivibrionaceae bacterium]|nr:DEAD/DEAH box helicase family protein [Succinivibrionaceae bacterium]